MSLIVAKMTETGPCIVSDTRVSYQDGTRSSYRNGTLKAIALSPEIALCFAGDVVKGLECARCAARQLELQIPLDVILRDLRDATLVPLGNVDFIVACQSPQPQIYRIRSGEIESDLHTAWIGDIAAFEFFQATLHALPEYYQYPARPVIEISGPTSFSMPVLGTDDEGNPHDFGSIIISFTPNSAEPPPQGSFSDASQAEASNVLPPSAVALMRMSHALNAVIENSSIPSVNDICVRLATKEGRFQYLGEMALHVGRDTVIRDGDNLLNIFAQSVEEGGFSICVVEPLEAGVPALGLCFPRARLAMIYLPLEFDDAMVIRDIMPSDFSATVFTRFGVRMSEPIIR